MISRNNLILIVAVSFLLYGCGKKHDVTQGASMVGQTLNGLTIIEQLDMHNYPECLAKMDQVTKGTGFQSVKPIDYDDMKYIFATRISGEKVIYYCRKLKNDTAIYLVASQLPKK